MICAKQAYARSHSFRAVSRYQSEYHAISQILLANSERLILIIILKEARYSHFKMCSSAVLYLYMLAGSVYRPQCELAKVCILNTLGDCNSGQIFY